MRMTLPFKFGLISLVITLAGVLGLAFFTFQSSDELLQRQALSRLADDIAREKEVLLSKMKILVEDVQFLTESPAATGIVRSVRGGGFDVDENMTLDLWRQRLESLFMIVLRQRAAYSQIRLIGIDGDGMEIVRVERYIDSVRSVSKDELQQKGSRAYFKEAIVLGPGEVYFSTIDLNREKGKISYPPETVLRVAVPILDSDGDVFGIVAVNVNFDLLAASLYEAPENIFYFLANEQGDYLIHPDSGKRMVFERNFRVRYQDDFPGLADDNPDHLEHESSHQAFFPEQGRGIAIDHLRFDLWNMPDRAFTIGAVAELSVLGRESRALLNKTIILVVLVTIVLALATAVFANHLTQPIRELTGVADRIAGGEVVEVPVHGADEIGQLALLPDHGVAPADLPWGADEAGQFPRGASPEKDRGPDRGQQGNQEFRLYRFP